MRRGKLAARETAESSPGQSSASYRGLIPSALRTAGEVRRLFPGEERTVKKSLFRTIDDGSTGQS